MVPALDKSKWKAMSSSVKKNDPQYGPHRAVDESCSLTSNDAFISKGVSMEWFMIKFPFSVSGIIRVEIAKDLIRVRSTAKLR